MIGSTARRIVILFAGVAACILANAQNGRPAEPKESPAVELPASLSETDPLPLLKRELRRPIRDEAHFEASTSSFDYRKSLHPLPVVPPFATDAELEAAARAWIEGYFGPLQPEVTLEVKEIVRESFNPAKERLDTEAGPKVLFRDFYRGILATGWASIRLTGNSDYDIGVSLYNYSVVPDSEQKIVSAEAAKKVWREVMVKHEASPESLAYFDQMTPRLVYVWSPQANFGPGGWNQNHLAPNWSFNSTDQHLVYGYTGVPWIDD